MQPAAAYQPAGRAYAIDDRFPGATPWGSPAVGPAPVNTTQTFAEQPIGGQPFAVQGTPVYSGAGYSGAGYSGAGYSGTGQQWIGQPGADGLCQPGYCQTVPCQPGCGPPVDPYSIYTPTPQGAQVMAIAGAYRQPFAELEGRFGDTPDSLHGHIFVPFAQRQDSFWFADIRGQWDEVDAREGNFGVAHRRFYGSHIFGIYGFYDLRETQFDNEFSGATVGIEALNLDWEGRLNFYIPEGGSQPTGGNAAVLVNDGIFVQQGIERAYYGFDGEVGRLLFRTGGIYDGEVRGFIGGYYFDADANGFQSFGGPRARLEGRLYDLPRLGAGSRLTFGGTVQYDDVRDVQGIASVNLRIPFGRAPATGVARLSPWERRMVSPIRRDDDIITTTGLGAQEQAVIVGNGKDGVVLANVTEVNSSTADVPAAVAGGSDVVVVTSNVETAATTVLNPGQFLGGTFLVRGQTSGTMATFGARRTINATGADAVQLADNASIAGLRITGDGAGITDGGAAVTGTTISNNTVSVSGGHALDLGATNTGSITGNTLTSTGDNGLLMAGLVSGEVRGNTASNNASEGLVFGTVSGGTISNNTTNNNQSEGFVAAVVSGGTISGNTASNNQSDGFFFGAISGGTISGNTANSNQTDGFEVNGAVSGGVISGNSASMNQGAGFDFQDFSGGSVTGNTASGNTSDGFRFDSTISGGTISGNTASMNQEDGFDFDAISAGTITGNAATNNQNDGFEFDGNITGGTISDNVATGNNTSGMGFGGFNFFSGNGAAVAPDVTINEDDGATMITGNRSDNNGRDGFAFGNIAAGTISGNTASGNNTDMGANGGNGGFSFFDITGGTISMNTSNSDVTFDGFFINQFTGGAFDNNDANDNAAMGLRPRQRPRRPGDGGRQHRNGQRHRRRYVCLPVSRMRGWHAPERAWLNHLLSDHAGSAGSTPFRFAAGRATRGLCYTLACVLPTAVCPLPAESCLNASC